jgi:ubiquinone/menaquinone biosynthesis C-methylase UbiE
MDNDPKAFYPDLIFYLHAAAAFQYLNAGVELGLFELLEEHGPLTLTQVADRVGLSPQSARCLLFGLSSLRLVEREGDYFHNGAIIRSVYERGEWQLIRSMTQFQGHIVYSGLADFAESLREDRNVGLDRIGGEGETLYQRLPANPAASRIFFEYMETYSDFALKCLLKDFDFSAARRILDVGGGTGRNAITIVERYPDARVTLLDLPPVLRMAEPLISGRGLSGRIDLYPCDMMKEEFPGGQDCVLFIHQLVIWSPREITALLKKAYESLSANGRVVIFSSVSDDDETGPLMAALDTAYFRAVAAGRGMIYPWKDYKKALLEVGFNNVEYIPCGLWTPHGIVVGYK